MSASTPPAASAVSLGIPDTFNAATYFVDRNVDEGLGAKVAIEFGTERITYGQVLEQRQSLRQRATRAAWRCALEERVLLLLLDAPEFAYSFFGAIKIGAVPIPINTLWKAADYEYILNDSRARVVDRQRGAAAADPRAIPRDRLRYLRDIVVVGDAPRDASGPSFDELLAAGSRGARTPNRPARTTRRSGCTRPAAPARRKGCVHLHHDMVVCAELYAQGVLGITSDDRFFSVAKLFFAYGLGNALYFPFAVGATTILLARAADRRQRLRVIETHRPTLFFSVPTSYAMLLAHRARPARLRSARRSGSRSRRAKRCRPPSSSGSRSASASTSWTASARPRSCTSSSRTSPAPSGLARAAGSCRATKRSSSTSTISS